MVNGSNNVKKQIDKATALLALAKVDENASNHCLTAQDMAELVDTRCEGRSQSEFHKHLSSCDNCYHEWLFLKSVQEQTQIPVYKLSNYKKFGFAGTALAAAASIAIFLNISKHQDIVFEQPPATQEMSTQMDNPPTSSYSFEAKREKNEPVSTSYQESVVQDKQEMDKEKAGQQYSPDNMTDVPSMPPAPPLRTSKRAIVAENIATPSKTTEKPAAFARWLDELLENCQTNQHSPSFWNTFKQKGEEILIAQPAGFPEEQKNKLQFLLELLSQIHDDESALTQCQAIRSELAEDAKSK